MTPAAARVHIREPTLLEEHGGIVLGAAELILESGGDCREELQRILSDIRRHDSDAGSATVTVRDHGHGIPPQDQPRIFDSFFSTKEKGMGLGLAIARSIVETHAGRIWLEPMVGEGATFCAELPLAVVAEQAGTGSP
mgnify:CR=1 FL=1